MANQTPTSNKTETTTEAPKVPSIPEHVAPPAKPLSEEVKAWLEENSGIYELLPNGKLQCQFTKHEIPGRIELLEKHLTSRKYLLAKNRAAVVIPDEYKEIVVKNEKKKKGNMLFCIVTKRSFLSTPEELSLHLSGRRFKNAYRKYLVQKEIEAKEAAELEDADDILKNEDMFLDMIKSDASDSEDDAGGSDDEDDENEDDEDMKNSDNEVDGMYVDEDAAKSVPAEVGKDADKEKSENHRVAASKGANKQKIKVQKSVNGNSRKRKAMSRGNKRKEHKSTST
ncbi:hypothetical protein SARC_09954 [Sphaeroforma arctica JP610]|uniref:Surfeit locus protein 2 n=1 Tax=Sphaeroforma arctica JP610 TaxID=667725 RepID=A0A0L0FLD6_9EUKA|nr:hypothetical protein SARC_09954 [Sphaeroforma arctica JP610]KNC77587.1 hypothetical protein SARC_09954 [Sphaeroforma arctica JP610]|eukprot:XP_014151489.1 hypothetical protein SARC_09954 [Sphaeroforma arctica JP610]